MLREKSNGFSFLEPILDDKCPNRKLDGSLSRDKPCNLKIMGEENQALQQTIDSYVLIEQELDNVSKQTREVRQELE